MRTLIQDLRFGFRTLAKRPGFTIIAVLTLALGIGANTAVFSLASAAFFRPLPFPHADRCAFLWQTNQTAGGTEGDVSYPNYADWRAQSRTFDDMAFIMFADHVMNGSGTWTWLNGAAGPERFRGDLVSTNFFSVMGVHPFMGREFVPDDSSSGHADVAVIGYSLWQTRFGGDPHVLGRKLGFGQEGDTVIGVMPRGFSFPNGAVIWKPRIVNDFLRTKARQYPNMGVIGSLKPGANWQQAQAEMDTIAQRLAAEYPDTNRDAGIRIVPLRLQLTEKVRQGLLLLWAAILAMLLIACLNIANLVSAHAASREKEIAIRFSLGATRGRVAGQFLAESLLLACAGAAGGLLLARWMISFAGMLNPDIARLNGGLLDLRVLAYAALLTILTALLCGLLPALATTRLDLNRVLKETGTAATALRAQTVRKFLITAQVCVAFVLLVVSGLLIRSLWQVLSVNPGFDARDAFSFRIAAPGAQALPNSAYRDLLDRFKKLPGVRAVGATSNVLFPDAMYKVPFLREGQPADTAGEVPSILTGNASQDLFRAMGIPLLRGREFTQVDSNGTDPLSVTVNEAAARRYWPDEDPIGKRLQFDDPSLKKSPWMTIVGIVGDVGQDGFERPAGPMCYLPGSDLPADDVVVRAGGDPVRLLAELRTAAAAADKNFVIYDFHRVSDMLAATESQRTFDALLLAALAVLALLLASIGIYGAVSYWVGHRTSEIGIRMALGAQRKDIFALVIARGMAMIAAGLAVGIAGALAATRILSSILFEVKATDPITYIGVALLLAAVAFLACYIPARRAMRIDPILALRQE